MARRLLRLGLVLVSLLLVRVSCIAWAGKGSARDAQARAAYLVERLGRGERGWGPDEHFAGEWHVVSLSMTALALHHLAVADPSLREAYRQDVERLAEVALRPSTRRFDTRAWGTDALATLATDEGHVGALGHVGLVLGVECALGSNRHRAQLDAIGLALRRRYLAAPDGLVETFPGGKWVPDSAAGLAAVELHARCLGLASAGAVARRWPREPGGLFRFTPSTPARGSGAGFVSVYLPLIDGCLAREQWALMRARFGVRPLPGLAALREWPHGVGLDGDVDSGPLVLGLSPAGTGFALAAASSAGDDAWRAGMLRVAEAAGFTVPFGGRHYALAPLVGDASVLAARTSTLAPACRKGASARRPAR